MSPHPTTVECTCEHCGCTFPRSAASVRSGRVRFCSPQCRSRHPRRPIEDRFWEKVDKTGECWIWKTTKLPSGYGQFTMPGRGNRLAHRVAYELFVGPIPDGLFVCHTCDCPSCVRPDHLFLGSPADNSRDMREKDRSPKGERSAARKHPGKIQRGIAHPQAILTDDEVRTIRTLYAAHEGTQEQLAARFGVRREAIGKIVRGERWRHLL